MIQAGGFRIGVPTNPLVASLDRVNRIAETKQPDQLAVAAIEDQKYRFDSCADVDGGPCPFPQSCGLPSKREARRKQWGACVHTRMSAAYALRPPSEATHRIANRWNSGLVFSSSFSLMCARCASAVFGLRWRCWAISSSSLLQTAASLPVRGRPAWIPVRRRRIAVRGRTCRSLYRAGWPRRFPLPATACCLRASLGWVRGRWRIPNFKPRLWPLPAR